MTSSILYGAIITTRQIIIPDIPNIKDPKLNTLLVPSDINFLARLIIDRF